MTEKFRTESDSMGEFQVPIEVKFGASTARAIDNFPISNLRFSYKSPERLELQKSYLHLFISVFKELSAETRIYQI